MKDKLGVPASPSGSQASPGAADASPPSVSVSVPNAEDAQRLADSGARRSYTLSRGTTLEVEGAKGFRLLQGEELRQAAIAAGLIPASGIEGEAGDPKGLHPEGESPARSGAKGDAR